jgi:hypothetical protein
MEMARRKINKSAKIREAFEKLGANARPKDVIAHLATRRIKVSSAQVSNIKSGSKARRTKDRKGRGRNRGTLVALSDLQAAKKLAELLGSVESARSALAALAKLQ